jgi:hypothetical protein
MTYYRRVSKSQFYTFLFFIVPLTYFMSLPISVGDLTVWVAQGLKTIQNGSLFIQDTFSVLDTKDQIYPAAITVLYGYIDLLGGLYVVTLFHKLIWLIILYIIYRNSIYKIQNPFNLKNLIFICIFLAASSLYLIDRPAFIALLFLLVAYLIIENNDEVNLKSIIQLFVVLVLWVNMHGSWPLLVVMYSWKYVFFLKTHNFTKRFCGGVFFILSAGVNPFGLRVYHYVLETMQISKYRQIDEWNAFNLTDYSPHGYIFLFNFLVVSFLVTKKIFETKKINILSSPLVPLMLLGFTAIRNVGLFSVVLLPFLFKFGYLSEGRKDQIEVSDNKLKKIINCVFAIMLVLMTFAFTPWVKGYLNDKYQLQAEFKKFNIFDHSAPIEFTNYIKKTGSTKPIMNDWDYGSFLMYDLKNQHLIDTRNIIYSHEDFKKYLEVFYSAIDWQDYVNQYQFGFAMLKKQQSHKLIQQMQDSHECKLVLENQEAVLLERTF